MQQLVVSWLSKAIVTRINNAMDIKASDSMKLLIFFNQNCFFDQISYRKDMQDTHTYNAELNRPDIKMATQLSKIISNVIIAVSYLEQKWLLIFEVTKHGFGCWMVNLMSEVSHLNF